MKQPLLSILLTFLLLSPPLLGKSSDYGKSRIKKLSWNGIDVTWLQDKRFPTYTIMIRFSDGALGDKRNSGLAHATFELLASGTRRFNQKQISDNLEYYGVSHGARVTHESVTYNINGMTENIIPTMMKICHLFKDARYPAKELSIYKKQTRSNLRSLVNSHSEMASRAFREISMSGTPFQHPVNGKLRSLKRITQKKLIKNLNHFNNKVKKRIYLYGSEKVLSIKKIIMNECGWNPNADFVRKIRHEKTFPQKSAKIHLVTVPQSNQAQILIGRYLNKNETKQDELHDLASKILAGDFTSVLTKELRVKRGWVYYVHTFSSDQRDYGRAVIDTATKNENVVSLLNVTRDSLQDVINGSFPKKQFKIVRNALAEKHPFRFQKGSSYLSQLGYLDHVGKDYSELYRFPNRVRRHSLNDVEEVIQKIYSWNKLTIMVLGPKSLKKSLKKLGPVNVTSYKKYL